MMTLQDLSRELEGKTTLQREGHITTLIGIEVELLGKILDIDTESISLGNQVPKLPEDARVHIRQKGDRRREDLVNYSSGDGVSLTTRLTGVRLGERLGLPIWYDFDLVSIRKLNAMDWEAESRSRNAEELKRKYGATLEELKAEELKRKYGALEELKAELQSKSWFGWYLDGLNDADQGLHRRRRLRWQIGQLEEEMKEKGRIRRSRE